MTDYDTVLGLILKVMDSPSSDLYLQKRKGAATKNILVLTDSNGAESWYHFHPDGSLESIRLYPE